jgi:hypothetical protein
MLGSAPASTFKKKKSMIVSAQPPQIAGQFISVTLLAISAEDMQDILLSFFFFNFMAPE